MCFATEVPTKKHFHETVAAATKFLPIRLNLHREIGLHTKLYLTRFKKKNIQSNKLTGFWCKRL